MTSGPALLAIHAAASLAMTGLIWFVQLVHYPLFSLAARHSFTEFALEHQRRTTWLVAPLMVAEAVAAGLLLARAPGPATWAGAALLAVIWLSTACLQVPQHRRLARGFEPRAAKRLLRTNWLRTVAWTARAGIALALFGGAAGI